MKKINGILYAMLSSAAFGFMPIFAKFAQQYGSNTLSIVSFRFLLAAFILFTYFLIRKTDFRVNKHQLFILMLIGLLGYTSTGLTMFYSYNYISVGLSTTMHFIYPAIVIVINYFVYKEGFTRNKIMALLLSMVGVYVLVGINAQGIHPLGAALALISGFTYAGCVTGMNHPEIKKLSNTVSVFYFSLFAGGALFLFTLFSKSFVFPMNVYTVSSILGIVFISTIASITLFIKALKIIGPSSTSILGTFEPIVSIVMGVLLFGERITLPIILGTLLILLSVVILAKDTQEVDATDPDSSF